MNNKELAQKIMSLLGGGDNINYVTHCVTRLRFTLKNNSKADLNKIKKLDGVIGVVEQNGQVQVIIGSHVEEVYVEITPLVNNTMGKSQTNKEKISIGWVLSFLTSIFAPIIPAFAGAGMMKAILALVTSLGLSDGTGGTFQVFSIVSDTAFYFLPFLVALSAAKRLQTDQFLALSVAGALMYPTIISAVGVEGVEPLVFLGIEVPIFSYAATIFPILLGIILLAYVYKFCNKIVTVNILKTIFVPLLALAITIPITLLFLAPIGNYIAIYLTGVISWMFRTLGPFAGAIVGFFMPIMVLGGLHQSLTPMEIVNMTTLGYDIVLPIEFAHNMAEAGAAIGVAVKSKNKKTKSLGLSTGVSALIGISEPALYGINVPKKKPLYCAMIANAIGGFFSVFFVVKCFVFMMPGIFSITGYVGGDILVKNLLFAILSMVLTFVIAFVLVIFVGFEEDTDEDTEEESHMSKQERISINKIPVKLVSPMNGRLIALEDVNDEVFSKKQCGEGIAILPSGNKIVAPCDGVIKVVMGHAIGIETSDGKEILIHLGLNTVELKGKYTKPLVKQGDHVTTGQELLQFDKKEIVGEGFDITTIVLCTNGEVEFDNESSEIRELEELFIIV